MRHRLLTTAQLASEFSNSSGFARLRTARGECAVVRTVQSGVWRVVRRPVGCGIIGLLLCDFAVAGGEFLMTAFRGIWAVAAVLGAMQLTAQVGGENGRRLSNPSGAGRIGWSSATDSGGRGWK